MIIIIILAHYRLLVLVIGLVSLLAIIVQTVFQSILLAKKPYGHIIENCM